MGHTKGLTLHVFVYACSALPMHLQLTTLTTRTSELAASICTMGPGPGLVAHVVWRYCMRLASSGVGGVRRVRLVLLYVGRGVWGGCIGHRVPSEG